MADSPQPPTPRPRVTRSSADRHTNAKSSLSLKWEDFFGSSVDLTSGVLGVLDTFTTDIDIDEPLPEDEELQLRSRTNTRRYTDSTDLSPSDSQLGSSPTDIVLLNALPAASLRHLTSGSRSSCTAPPAARQRSTLPPPSPGSASNGAPLPAPRQLSATLQSADSGYVSEEAVPAAAAASSTSSSHASGPTYRSATLPCRGRQARTTQQLRQDAPPAEPVTSSPQRSALHSSAPDNSACDSSSTPTPVPCQSPTPTPCGADMDTAGRVVMELVETERGYVKDLELIVQGYMEPMSQANQFQQDSVSMIFCVLPDLLSFHRDLLADLVDAQGTVSSCGYGPLAECFVDNRKRFQHYTHYCTNFPRSLSHLEELQQSPSGSEFFTSRQRALNQMLPLATFLLKPVQRILKYHLLLQSLAKAVGSPEPAVSKAAACMSDVAAQINELQRRHEHALRVKQLQSLLKSAHLDLGSLGELVLEDNFRVHGKKGTRQVFLFHKAILLGKRLENGMLAIKEVIRCANLMLVESIPKEPMSFHVLPFDNPKAQETLQARKLDQKRKWCTEIKRRILENYNTAIPEKAKQLVLSMNPEDMMNDAVISSKRFHRIDNVSGPCGHGNGTNNAAAAEEWEENPMLVSRCFSSTEDLVTIHEEAWQELLRRNVYSRDQADSCSSSQDSDSEKEAFLDDLRCIAVEINEEQLGDAPPRQVRGHRRQPSAGRAQDMSIDITAANIKGGIVPPAGPTSNGVPAAQRVNSTGVNGNGSGSGSRSNPIYIHCPVGGYDQLVFGKAYQEYIEKTKEKIALSPSDIDEIFRPLRELHVEVDSPGVGSAGGNEGASQPSSADSSPRHIVSRIATSSNCLAAATATRVIQVEPSGSKSEENLSQPEEGGGSGGKPHRGMGSMFGGLKSKLRKNSSTSLKRNDSNSSVDEPNGNSAGGDDTVPQLPKRGFVSKFVRDLSASPSKNRPEKPSRKFSSPALSTPRGEAPAPERPPTGRTNLTRNNSSPNPRAAPPKPPPPRQNTSPEHKPPGQNTLRRKNKNAPPPPTPPQSTSSNSLNGNLGAVEPEKEDVSVCCRGKVRAAMTDLLDSLPYADDESSEPVVHREHNRSESLDSTVCANRRATGEWAADNIYWKRALMDTKPSTSPGGTGIHPAPHPPPPRRVGAGAALPPPPEEQHPNPTFSSKSLRPRPPRPLAPASPAVSQTMQRRLCADTDEGDGEGEEKEEPKPKPGTVKNMISRFQFPT